MATVHTRAFNLARRATEKYENDLLQENFMDAGASSYATERYCSSLLNQHLPRDFELPQECKNYASVRAALQKSAADVDPAVAFAGMSPGEAQAAQSAREHRRPNSAQIKRRLTSRSKDSSSSWF